MLQFDTTPTQSLASVIFSNSQMTSNSEFQTVGFIVVYEHLRTKWNSTNIRKVIKRCHTVEPLYNEVIGTANDFFTPVNGKIYGKGPRYNETVL